MRSAAGTFAKMVEQGSFKVKFPPTNSSYILEPESTCSSEDEVAKYALHNGTIPNLSTSDGRRQWSMQALDEIIKKLQLQRRRTLLDRNPRFSRHDDAQAMYFLNTADMDMSLSINKRNPLKIRIAVLRAI